MPCITGSLNILPLQPATSKLIKKNKLRSKTIGERIEGEYKHCRLKVKVQFLAAPTRAERLIFKLLYLFVFLWTD